MKSLKLLTVVSLLCLAGCRPATNEEPRKTLQFPPESTELFNRYVALEAAFDPALADLYADDAVIKNTRRYPDGTAETKTLPAPVYKELIRKSLPDAKAKGDTSTYTSPLTKVEDGKLRVTSVRYSNLKQYYSPLSLLIGKRGDRWLIVEELSESQGVSLDPPIRELKLADGRVLNKVWVTSIAPTHLTARWSGGGKGVIPVELLPDDYREAVMRALRPKAAGNTSAEKSKTEPAKAEKK